MQISARLSAKHLERAIQFRSGNADVADSIWFAEDQLTPNRRQAYGVFARTHTLPGGKYTLTFALGSSTTYGLPDGFTASAGSTSQTFTSTVTGSNDWEIETMQFTADSSSTVVSFLGNSGDNYIGLDSISVVGPGVPEPAAWTMLLIGVGLVGAGLRATRKATQFA